MKPPDVSPKLFRFLDKIKKKYKVSDAAWAEASGFKQPRISETRKYIRLLHEGKTLSDYKQAAWDHTKWLALLGGLKKIVGASTMRQELLEEAEREVDPDLKLEYYVRALEGPEKDPAVKMLAAVFELRKQG